MQKNQELSLPPKHYVAAVWIALILSALFGAIVADGRAGTWQPVNGHPSVAGRVFFHGTGRVGGRFAAVGGVVLQAEAVFAVRGIVIPPAQIGLMYGKRPGLGNDLRVEYGGREYAVALNDDVFAEILPFLVKWIDAGKTEAFTAFPQEATFDVGFTKVPSQHYEGGEAYVAKEMHSRSLYVTLDAIDFWSAFYDQTEAGRAAVLRLQQRYNSRIPRNCRVDDPEDPEIVDGSYVNADFDVKMTASLVSSGGVRRVEFLGTPYRYIWRLKRGCRTPALIGMEPLDLSSVSEGLDPTVREIAPALFDVAALLRTIRNHNGRAWTRFKSKILQTR